MLRTMWLAAAVVATATTTAAAQKSIGQQNLERELAIISQEDEARTRQFRASMNQSVRDLISVSEGMLAEFRGAADPTCSSKAAADTRDQAADVIKVATVLKAELQNDAIFAVAGHWMDVADLHRARGCADDARRMYEEVFRRYPEMAYGGLRDRAKAALDGMR